MLSRAVTLLSDSPFDQLQRAQNDFIDDCLVRHVRFHVVALEPTRCELDVVRLYPRSEGEQDAGRDIRQLVRQFVIQQSALDPAVPGHVQRDGDSVGGDLREAEYVVE